MTTKVPFDMLKAAAIASQSEAEAGTVTDKLMTPQRAAQAISALQTPFSWGTHATFATTGRSTPELITTLPLGAANWYVVFSLGPFTVTTDDLIVAMAEFEVTTNEDTYNVGVWSQIILGTSSSDTTPVSNGELTDNNGRNITLDMNHDTHAKCGMIRSPVNSSQLYVNFRAYANSTSGTANPSVEQDYGHMDVLVLKNFF